LVRCRAEKMFAKIPLLLLTTSTQYHRGMYVRYYSRVG
jgi:hypothetical protein